MTAPTLSLTSLNLPLLVTAATLYTTGGVLIKLSEGLTRPYSLLLVAVTPGAALQALAVRHAQLSVTYLLVLGLEAGLALAGSVLIFRESLSPPKLFWLSLIVGSVACLHLSSAQG